MAQEISTSPILQRCLHYTINVASSCCRSVLTSTDLLLFFFFFPPSGYYEETHEGGASTFPTKSHQPFLSCLIPQLESSQKEGTVVSRIYSFWSFS